MKVDRPRWIVVAVVTDLGCIFENEAKVPARIDEAKCSQTEWRCVDRKDK
jgi:hypothetical protein